MAQENDQAWDDLHFGMGDNEPPIVDPNALPVDDIPDRVFADEDGLEAAAGKTKDPDDDLPLGTLPVDPNKPDVPKPDEVIPTAENMSGIELYLSQFDIEAGMIQFDDGTSQHFNELDATKQAEVLQNLHATQVTTTEDQYGLDGNEIGLINYLRENNLSVEQMIDSMVNEKVNTMMTMQELNSEDYSKMDADTLYVKFLKETSPEATPDQIASDLAKAKEQSNFPKITEALKTQFTAKQQEAITAKTTEATTAHAELVETQRKEIVQAVLPMTELAGIPLDNNIKNTVLEHILETNEEGDSAFMDEVFSDPQSLFKAAFWYVYGEALVAQRDEYWKKEKSAAYKRGKEDALGTSEPTPKGRSFTTKPVEKPHTTQPAGRKQETSNVDWEDLHDS